MKFAVPRSLPPISDAVAPTLRVAWLAALAFAIGAQVLGLGFALRDAFRTQPAFGAFGLASGIEYEGRTTASPLGAQARRQRIAEDSRIVAINGTVLPPHTTAEAIATRLRQAPKRVTMTLRDPQGRTGTYVLTRAPLDPADALRRNPVPRSVRMTVRLLFAMLAAVTLIGSAIVLFRRRPRDPQAVLFSFAFLLIAAAIDPPLPMWMGTGLTPVVGGVTGLWWTLLVIAFAAFPNGRFSPGWLRWSIVIAPLLGVVLALDIGSDLVGIVVGVGAPLLVLAALVRRYRRLGPGIGRQQIKWAASGFVAGFVLLGLSVALASFADGQGWSAAWRAALYLGTVCMFSIAFILIPLGLLVSLLGYRLWEADTVIRSSANYAALTLIIGFVFTVAADVTKALIDALFGEQHAVISTTLGALVAVAVFNPVRTVVLRWSKQRYETPIARVDRLPEQIAQWRHDVDAPELGMRVLAVLTDGLHARYAALFALTPVGRELVAACNVADHEALAALQAGDAHAIAWADVRLLHCGDVPVGTLMLGARSDDNRFNRQEREALEAVLAPLADALSAARRRAQAGTLQALELRLARLEGTAAPVAGPGSVTGMGPVAG